MTRRGPPVPAIDRPVKDRYDRGCRDSQGIQIISLELGLLFPRFMAYAGGIIGLPFSLEGAAFFLEAIFVGIYLYGWNRLSPRAH